jgi:sugar phosphate isomerase/epimerase
VLLELFRRGYRLGIASNTISSSDIPEMLHGLRLAGYFETVLLSGEFGRRKPDPTLLSEAAKQINQPPAACAYIGNRTDRDVIAARGAGYAKVVLLRDPAAPHLTAPDGDLQADHCIDSLNELLEIFPEINGAQPKPRQYQVSLSTMWAIKNFDRLEDFLIAAGRYGYGQVELNHQISPQMLEGIPLARYPLASIHEPCPAEPSLDELKQRDWLISSPDEEKRIAGVTCVKRSLDLAHQLGIGVVVVHAGQLTTDLTSEKQLRALYAAGQKDTPAYDALKQHMIAERERVIAPYFNSVKRSLRELLDHAAPLGVRLGLENRYHWTDIPTQDEMEELLALGEPDRLGFIFDSGHAAALDRLGFYPFEGWLKRFSQRMFGCHLHDVVGLEDHYAPGLGDVDFDLIARHLPPQAFRTVELKTSNTAQQVIAGAHFLAQKGIIKSI